MVEEIDDETSASAQIIISCHTDSVPWPEPSSEAKESE